MLRFTLFGFTIRVQWMFWLIGLLLGSGLLRSNDPRAMQYMVVWIAVFFVSILWHELGHAFAMRKYGGRPEILLYGMGGVCSSVGQYSRNQSMLISAAGPAAGFLLALIALGLSQIPAISGNSFGRFAIGQLIWINTFWTLMNLLPVLPLDGGQILRAFMANRNPTVAPKVGAVTAGIVAILGLVLLKSLWIAVLFGYLAYQNWNMSKGYSPNQRPF